MIIMPFKIIDHTADVAIIAYGNSIEDLFESACLGWKFISLETQIENFELSKKFLFSSSSYEELLIELLNELNFQLYANKFVFLKINKLTLTKVDSSIQLNVEAAGQKYNPEIHTIKEEIKGVTFHQIKIENVNGIFQTKIVFDI